MTVQTLSYIIFVVIIFIINIKIRSSLSRKIFFLVASYVFYALWGIPSLFLLIFSSAVNFGCGRYIRAHPSAKRLSIGVAFNILMLVAFKYIPEFETPRFSGPTDVLWRISMPVGISFWTFQALSYLFDVYREEPICPSILEFFLYMSFWPTVLSGPITRVGEIVDQFRQNYKLDWTDVRVGCRRILTGLFMKLFLSQLLARGLMTGQGLDSAFDQISSNWGGTDVWTMGVGYGLQLFFDFAGYSQIVIGTARVFSIRLPENFDKPYLSSTPSMFWTRWHMSLSFWIRDYIFLPLVTVKRSTYWRHLTLLIAMTLFGLWHGATGPFVAWGIYQGLVLIGHRQWQNIAKKRAISTDRTLIRLVGWAVTYAMISLGWILFRARDLRRAILMYRSVLMPSTYRHLALDPNLYVIVLLVTLGFFFLSLVQSMKANLHQFPCLRRVVWLLSPVYFAALVVILIVWSNDHSGFVYFRF